MSDFQLDKLDHQILSMVGDDARVPFLEVARICGVSGAAIHQRVTRLTRLGVLRGSHFDMNPEVLGYETIAFIGPSSNSFLILISVICMGFLSSLSARARRSVPEYSFSREGQSHTVDFIIPDTKEQIMCKL